MLFRSASPRNKFNVYFDNSWRYWNASLVGVSSESEQKYDFPRLWQVTGGWSSPVSNKMLIDVRGGMHKEDIFNFYDPDPNGVYRNLIGVVEQNQVIPGIGSIGTFRYRGRSNTNDTGIALLVCNVQNGAGSRNFRVVPPFGRASRPGSERTVFGNARIALLQQPARGALSALRDD